MDDRFASDLQIALYANLIPDYPSSDLSTETHSYAAIQQHRKLSQGDEECRQNIYVNVPPIYMNLPSNETKDHDEINLVPNCRDKSDLYCQQKMPLTIAPICPILIHNRTNPTRRTRRPRPRPRVIHRYSAHPRRRIRRPRSRPQTIEPISIPSTENDEDQLEEPLSTLSKKIAQSISENIPTEPIRSTTTHDHDETSDDELFPHETFEDFLFRRRTHSTSSSEKSPPTPPRNRPSLSKRYARGANLGLEESDVDFLHRLIQRSREEREILHQINVLREAYRRTAMNRNQYPHQSPLPIVHPWISQRIQNEMEKYDQVYEMNADEVCPSAIDRFKHFLSTVKRRAQDNFQQLKENFRTFRTRLIMETISSPSHHRHRYYHTTDLRRMHRSRPSHHRHPPHHRPTYTR